MAFRQFTITLTGSAQQITSVHTPVKQVHFSSATGNNNIFVGDSNITASAYGMVVAAGPSAEKEIGPFGGGECPLNLNDVYVIGTGAEVLRGWYVTL